MAEPWSASVFVPGPAMAQGSKRIGRTRDGRPLVLDDNPGLKSWRGVVSAEMHARRPPQPLDGPVKVVVTVYVPRPRSHYGTGRNAEKLKPSAPGWPPAGLDVDKVARACLDAGTGIWWRDDQRVCLLWVMRLYASEIEPEGLRVIAEALG